MGIVYIGAYADIVNEPTEHEGYAARVMPDGALNGTWGVSSGLDSHVALTGACACGWQASVSRPPGSYGSPEYEAAEADFETQHLDPLIADAAQRAWPAWATRTADLAWRVAACVAEGRLKDAARLLADIGDDLDLYRRVVTELHERPPQRPEATATAFAPEATASPAGQPNAALRPGQFPLSPGPGSGAFPALRLAATSGLSLPASVEPVRALPITPHR